MYIKSRRENSEWVMRASTCQRQTAWTENAGHWRGSGCLPVIHPPPHFTSLFLAPHTHMQIHTCTVKMTPSPHTNTLCYTVALLRLLGIISTTENQRPWVWLCLWAGVSFCTVNSITGSHTLTHRQCQKSNLVMTSQGWTHKNSNESGPA